MMLCVRVDAKVVIGPLNKYKSIQIKWLKCLKVNRFDKKNNTHRSSISLTRARFYPILFILQPAKVATCNKDHDTTQLLFIPSIGVVMATGQASNEQRLFCADIVFILMAFPY